MLKRSQPQDLDLDRTDRLPIIEGVLLDFDVEDDAVPMDDPNSTTMPSMTLGGAADFTRPSAVDLPSLAHSVRSVEARIERQNAEYEALSRSFERVRETELAATARANGLEKELAAARAALEAEQSRSREIEKTLLERAAAIDATTIQVLQSLGERDAQLAALRLEHEKMLPALQDGEKATAKLQADLASARAQVTAVTAELHASHELTASARAQLKRGESEANASRSVLAAAKSQAASYLELLRTRAWRSGFDQNLFRDMDAKVGAADSRRDALENERDLLQAQLAELSAKLAAQNAEIDHLRNAVAAQAAAAAQHSKDLKQEERIRAEWSAKLASAEKSQSELRGELAARDRALAEAVAGASGNQQRIVELEADAANREEEMAVLMAHLQEARRPIQVIEADLKRLREDVALKAVAIKELTDEGEKSRATLERTRGALEEREFLIRRLERSESNNATALGRIQTSMERLGSVAAAAPTGAASPEWSAEFQRIDGEKTLTHTLGRRTRIGRAQGCELHIDSSSVSRYHALVLGGPHEAIIEDLNSTNGVIVNGRKVSRQVLADGDVVIIGETQFRYVVKPPITAP